jgi:hypothetical protein
MMVTWQRNGKCRFPSLPAAHRETGNASGTFRPGERPEEPPAIPARHLERSELRSLQICNACDSVASGSPVYSLPEVHAGLPSLSFTIKK